jgi:OOP family OmpA-OmpF porin
VIACALGATVPADAEPDARLEASGFVGLDYFGDNIQLGNSWAPEQVPGTSPLLGARVSYVALPALWAHDDLHLDLGAEAELALATAFTGGNFDGGRMSYFAPVFGWRAHALLRLGGVPYARPHLVVGVGGETVASSSPYMAKETDPVVYWGPGVSIPVSTSWQLRIDLRHGIMPAREGSATSTLELQLGLATTFGLPRKAPPVTVIVRDEPVAPPTVVDEHDTDGDGLPDRLDTCPNEAETVNGIEDDDGCPEPDPDGDGLVGTADRCPDQAEDFDKFEDDDGCPDPDNDHDGVVDARDACPNEPETKNGIDDDDGCPDTIPSDVTTALGAASAVKFDAGRAKLTEAAKKALELTVGALREHASLRITIVGHPDKKGADLARRRADAIKWHLVDQGVAADQIAITVGAPATARGPTIEIVLSPIDK